jgi:hypothetical protein
MDYVVHYPNNKESPSRASTLALHLPAGTSTDLKTLKKTRDPHVHYTFYESQVASIHQQMDQFIEGKLADLRRLLVQQARLYRYRLCNNCRKVYTDPVDFANAALSPFQRDMTTVTGGGGGGGQDRGGYKPRRSILKMVSSVVKPAPADAKETWPIPAATTKSPADLTTATSAPVGNVMSGGSSGGSGGIQYNLAHVNQTEGSSRVEIDLATLKPPKKSKVVKVKAKAKAKEAPKRKYIKRKSQKGIMSSIFVPPATTAPPPPPPPPLVSPLAHTPTPLVTLTTKRSQLVHPS